MRGEAFERYLEIFYKRPCIDIAGDNLEEEEEHVDKKEQPYSADLGRGFFPISRQSTRSKKGTGASAESIEKVAPKPIRSLSMSEFKPITLEEDDKILASVKEQGQMSQ